MSNRRQYQGEVDNFWRYQDRKNQENNNTVHSLANIMKSYKVFDNAIKTQQMAKHGHEMVKLYADPTNVEVVGGKEVGSLFTKDQISSLAGVEAPKSGLLSGLKQTFLPSKQVTNLATIGETATSAGAGIGSATGTEVATAGVSGSPWALALMALMGVGAGMGRKNTTLGRWNNNVKGWLK